MRLNQPVSAENELYYFTRVKDTHEENGQIFITLFARLKKTNSRNTKSLWVEIDEVRWGQASDKLKMMPNGESIYLISEEVFHELKRLTENCYEELYTLTPIYKDSSFKRLA